MNTDLKENTKREEPGQSSPPGSLPGSLSLFETAEENPAPSVLQDFTVASQEAVIRLGPYAALVLSILVRLSYGFQKQNGSGKFYRAVPDIVSQAPGMMDAAVTTAIKTLTEQNLIVINPGGIKGPNQSNYFRITNEGWKLAEKKPVLKIGLDDACSFGLPAALLLGHLEYRYEIGKNFISVTTVSEYLGLNKRTVQRDLKALFAEEVIIGSPFKKKERLRYFEFNPDHGRKRLRESRLSNRGTENRSGCTPSYEAGAGAGCEGEMVYPTQPPELESITFPMLTVSAAKLTFPESSSTTIQNPLALQNAGVVPPSIPELESIIQRGKTIIDAVGPEQILTILQGSAEEIHELVTTLIQTSYAADPDLAAFLLEVLTSAFLIRRNPAIKTSHISIRRAAYRLTLHLQPRLEESVRYRETILKSLTEGDFAEATLPAADKVRLLEDAVSVMNTLGIPENAPPKYSVPNPVILLNQITFGSGGKSRAFVFFNKNPDCTVAHVVDVILRESQPKPDSRGKPKHARINLSGLFTDFRKLEAARDEY